MEKSIKIVLPLIFALGVLLSSCSKKKDDPAPATPNTPTTPTTPTTPDNTNPTSVSGDYLPLTAGNIWNYKGDNQYTTTVTSNKKTIEGKEYTVLTQGDPSETEPMLAYAYRDGNKYYSYSETEVGPISLKLIDLDLPVGTKWSTTIKSTEASDVIYTSKVIGTGLSRTVNTIPYKDVISVEIVTTMVMNAAYKKSLLDMGMDASVIALMEQQFAAANYSQTTYYAKNIGVIEQTSATKGLNIYLVSSVIK